MRTLTALSAMAVAMAFPGVALAENEAPGISPSVESAYDGDYLVVGAGGLVIPDYDGSDDYKVAPALAFRGRVGGIGIFSRGMGVGADLIPEIKGSRIGLTLGPVVRYRTNRHRHVQDSVVRLLPKLAATWEAGVTLGISYRRLLTPKDSLSLNADVRWTVSGNKGGQIITSSINYFTPISKAAGVGLSVGADHVNRDYADFNYSVDAAGALASGLPEFRAKSGWKDWSARFYAGYDLDGNLRNGGWAVGAVVTYQRLLGSAAATPITSLRGSRDQWIGGVGVGYTF